VYAAILAQDADDAAFRAVARRCLAAQVEPRQVTFVDPDEPSLLAPLPEPEDRAISVTVPRSFSELMQDVICHRATDRFALLYDMLWRIVHGERDLVSRASDPAVARLNDYAHSVNRDIHKMHAFLRFQPRHTGDGVFYTAWFEPMHRILKRAVPFFIDRFAQMDWLIATPDGTALWRDGEIAYGPPVEKPAAEADHVLEDLWPAYYRATFNPARLRLKAMTAHMPKHYWAHMPETGEIAAMVADAPARVAVMKQRAPDQPELFATRIAARGRPQPDIPRTPIAQLRAEASGCQRCPLYKSATQTVFGEGPENARLVFVGEQPGDQEDLAGRPFVGPAGEVFDRALAQAGIDRASVYVTNAVKHFKYTPRGKKRMHQKPSGYEIEQCRWWIERELAAIAPELTVALGGSAAQSLAGRQVSVLRERGPADFGGRAGFITVHPSFLLRLPDAASKEAEYANFIADLRRVREMMARAQQASAS
jgi:DNA polymerase